MFVISDGFPQSVEEDLHRRRIRIGHHEREGVVCARLYGREDIGEGETPVAEPLRALAALPPDMADAALLTDARLVLEEQAESACLYDVYGWLAAALGLFLKASASAWFLLQGGLASPSAWKSQGALRAVPSRPDESSCESGFADARQFIAGNAEMPSGSGWDQPRRYGSVRPVPAAQAAAGAHRPSNRKGHRGRAIIADHPVSQGLRSMPAASRQTARRRPKRRVKASPV